MTRCPRRARGARGRGAPAVAGRGRRRHAARRRRARRRRGRVRAAAGRPRGRARRRTATAAPRCTGRCIATTCRWSRRCCAPARGSTPRPIWASRRSISRAPTAAPPMVARLLEAGADPNPALPSGETPLMNCARTGDAAAVRALLARGARVDARESAHQQTALMWAAANGHPGVVRGAAVGRGRSARALDGLLAGGHERGDAARRPRGAELHRARAAAARRCCLRRDRATRSRRALLLEAGADPNDALADGLPALTLAAYSGHGGVAARAARQGRRSQRRGDRLHRAPRGGAAIRPRRWCGRCWRAGAEPERAR